MNRYPNRVEIRVSDKWLDALKRYADVMDMTVAQAVRQLVAQGIEQAAEGRK